MAIVRNKYGDLFTMSDADADLVVNTGKFELVEESQKLKRSKQGKAPEVKESAE